jgi:hydroxyethylthiazole kinase
MNPEQVGRYVEAIRERHPMIHNITNFVVMNTTANALLAVGAAPVMAHAAEEAAEMTALADALVLNIGTLAPDWVESMLLAGKAAARKGIPIVLDPVGAGATHLRSAAAQRLLGELPVTVVRGNASEILALAGGEQKTRGVDTAHTSADALEAAHLLASRHGAVVAVTGATDYVTDGNRVLAVDNGHPLLTRVTGTGCVASALTGAFCAVSRPQALEGTAAALAFYGLCAEIAGRDAVGPADFEIKLRDAMFAATSEQILTGVKLHEM